MKHEITQLLLAWNEGDGEALEQLTPLVYDELHRMARNYMSGERRDHTLQTTGLISETFMRLIDWKNVLWQNRAHFFGCVAQMMRRILVDYARSRSSKKRSGGVRVSLDEAARATEERSHDLVVVDDALKALESRDARKGRIVELRFFGGLSVDETAFVLGISERTVDREWSLARAWLYRELKESG